MSYTIPKRGTMPDGAHLLIEDWSVVYPGLSDPFTVVAYPVAKTSIPGAFAPKAGETFRCGFCFPTLKAAEAAFSALENGNAQLSDYAKYMDTPRYRPCI